LQGFFGTAAGLSASAITRLTSAWQNEYRTWGLDSPDEPVLGDCGLDLDRLLPGLPPAGEVLVAILDPFDRSAEAAGGGG